MLLHESIKRLYSKIINVIGIEVLSDTGWQEITSLNISKPQKLIKIEDGVGNSLVCTPDHILICYSGEECFAKDSLGKQIKTSSGSTVITRITDAGENETYDLSLAENSSHTYFANDFLSHNCVILDEFAFLNKNVADKLFTSMYPVISSSNPPNANR